MTIRKTEKRVRALIRLEEQLKRGTKPSKEKDIIGLVDLTDSDIKRINKELKQLKKVTP